jgi:hypothetical protein
MEEYGSGKQLLSELKQRSFSVILSGLVLTAVLLGCGVNYLSSILFALLWKPEGSLTTWQWIQLSAALAVIVVGLIYVAQLASYTRPSVERRFEVMLPFRVTTTNVTIPELPRYHPTREAAGALALAFRKDAEGKAQQMFLDSWNPEFVSGRSRRLKGFALDCLYDLVERLVLQYVNEFGQRTLGSNARFVPGGDLDDHVSAEKRTLADLDPALVTNYVISNDLQFSERKFLVPKGMRLGAETLPKKGFIEEDGGAAVSRLVLRSPYGTFAITPSQIWQHAPEYRRTGRILEKRLEHSDQVTGFLIQMQMRVEFSQRFFLTPWSARGFENHFLWLVGLMDHLERRLAWSHFLETDNERMLVEMYDKATSQSEKNTEAQT